MNLLELIEYMRVSILDDTGGLGIDWTGISDTDNEATMLRWSNEELTQNINEAIRQVYRRILPVKDIAITISVVAGTDTYALNPLILQLLGVKSPLTNKALGALDIEDIWDVPQWEGNSGDPLYYIPNYDTGNIRLYPTPTQSDTLDLMYYRLPLVELAWTSNTVTPELRTEFQIPMLNYALFLAYMKDEANSNDPQKATNFLALFNQEFPATSAYSDNRKRKTTNRQIKYGGLHQSGTTRSRNKYGSLPFDPYF